MATVAEAIYANCDRQVCEVQCLSAWIEPDVRNHPNPQQTEHNEGHSHYSKNCKNDKMREGLFLLLKKG